MQDIEKLRQVIDRLLAPNGCPWDREQTLHSMRGSVLEEVYEVIEAINLDNNQKIEEELGDLLFNVLFLCKLAEKENRFTTSDVCAHIVTKLIRRHPHIFGKARAETTEEVLRQWEEIKKQEKGSSPAPASLLDHIPVDLPALARTQELIKKMRKAHLPLPSSDSSAANEEEKWGAALFELVSQAQEKGIDAEQALRKFLVDLNRDQQST